MSYPIFIGVPADDTLPIFFASYGGADGESITLSGLAVTGVEIYKDGGTTQRASDNGVTLLDTDGIDFDGTTGIHGISINFADNSDSGFYTAGSWYTVIINGLTVDSQSVSFIATMIRLAPAEATAGYPKVDTQLIEGVDATNQLDAATTGLAAADDLATVDSVVAAISGQTTAILADTNELQSNQGNWLTATGFSTLDAAGVRAAVGLAAADLDAQLNAKATASSLAILAGVVDTMSGQMDSVVDDVGEILTDTGTTLPATLSTIVADTNELQTDWADGGRLDLLLDAAAAGSASIEDIADAVLLEQVTDHSSVAGSLASYILAAGASGDPWIVSLPGPYTGDQAGAKLSAIDIVALAQAVANLTAIAPVVGIGTATEAATALLYGNPHQSRSWNMSAVIAAAGFELTDVVAARVMLKRNKADADGSAAYDEDSDGDYVSYTSATGIVTAEFEPIHFASDKITAGTRHTDYFVAVAVKFSGDTAWTEAGALDQPTLRVQQDIIRT